MQHCQHRRRPDSRAEQHYRPLSGLQSETAARLADVEPIADSHMVLDVVTSRAVRLELHADAITLRRLGTRERVAAKQRLRLGRRSFSGGGRCLKTQYHVLAWERR